MTKKQAEDELDQQIIQTIKKSNPETVQQLISQVQASSARPKQEILNRTLRLQQEGKIRLKPAPTQIPDNFASFLTSNFARWYWITITLTIVTTVAVFTIPENGSPLVYLRYVLGTIYVLWLPGYAFIRALFPRKLPFAEALAKSFPTTEQNLDTIERIALSLGMSIALVPIAGLLLNYTPWGIRLTPIVLSLLAMTLIFATAAIIREHQTKPQKNPS